MMAFLISHKLISAPTFSSLSGLDMRTLHCWLTPCCRWRAQVVCTTTDPLCFCGWYVPPGVVSMFSPTCTYSLCTFCKSEPLSWASAQHSSSPLELVFCSELQTMWRSCLALVAIHWRTRATPGTVYPITWNHAILPGWLPWTPLDTTHSQQFWIPLGQWVLLTRGSQT